MKKLVIKLILVAFALWSGWLGLQWSQAYTRAYVAEAMMTGPCSCTPLDIVFDQSGSYQVVFTSDGDMSAGPAQSPQLMHKSAYELQTACWNDRAVDTAWFSIFDQLMAMTLLGVWIVIVYLAYTFGYSRM